MQRDSLFFLLSVYIYSQTVSWSAAFPEKTCLYIASSSFTHCGIREAELERYQRRKLNRVYNVDSILAQPFSDNNHSESCMFSEFCRPVFKTARVYLQSFGAKISVHFSEMLRRCCGNCSQYHQTDLTTPLEYIERSLIDTFDFIYPIHSSYASTELYGYHFIPVLDVPGRYYFTLQRSDQEMATDIAYAIFKLCPLMLMCLMLCVIVGFFIWILDTWGNEEQFDRRFAGGLRDGFWFSYVTMTTVGFGDKTPKSLPARLFSIIWIMVGVTISSIYVASLATDIMELKHPPIPEMSGRNVGMLKDRLFDSIIISQHEGIIQEFPYNDTISGIIDMFEALQAKRIDGFLLNRPTYYFFSRMVDEDYPKLSQKIRNAKLTRTEKFFRGDRLVAGMAVKDYTVFRFFKSYFESNWLQIQGCYASELNSKQRRMKEGEENRYQFIGGILVPFFFLGAALLVAIACFGVLYEFRRRKLIVPSDVQN